VKSTARCGQVEIAMMNKVYNISLSVWTVGHQQELVLLKNNFIYVAVTGAGHPC
jgi:predicted heme/steroid binding protein